MSLLKFAFFQEQTEAAVFAALLEAGADPNARDKDDRTPLHSAARSNGNEAVVAALLEAGADPNARDKDDRTPLHSAARSNGNPAVFAALLEAGADLKARDEEGKLPFDHARENESLKDTGIYWRLSDGTVAPAGAADCKDWNTRGFFEAASAAVVAACLDAGTDLGVCAAESDATMGSEERRV